MSEHKARSGAAVVTLGFLGLLALGMKPFALFLPGLLLFSGIRRVEHALVEQEIARLFPFLLLIATFLLMMGLFLSFGLFSQGAKALACFLPLLPSMLVEQFCIRSEYPANTHLISSSLLMAMGAILTSLTYFRETQGAGFGKPPQWGWPFAWYGGTSWQTATVAIHWIADLFLWFNIAFVVLVLAEIAKYESSSPSVRQWIVSGAMLFIILLPAGAALFNKVFGKSLSALHQRARLASMRRR